MFAIAPLFIVAIGIYIFFFWVLPSAETDDWSHAARNVIGTHLFVLFTIWLIWGLCYVINLGILGQINKIEINNPQTNTVEKVQEPIVNPQ